ncbi:hypothetical protein [Streptomyces sp. NPDC058773]|uniref:hypothetical protein n=1 Tax=Streptomyces sp. NPDC058773 TaxID=3346632 RepID=UPI00369FF768
MRHPFEPARLIWGLTALTLATAYGLDALALWQAPGPWLFLALPAALILSGIVTAVRGRSRHPHTDASAAMEP